MYICSPFELYHWFYCYYNFLVLIYCNVKKYVRVVYKVFDSHVHSSFSLDSEMKLEHACKKAISTGLSGMAFTDHLDYDYPGYENSFNIDFEKYIKYLERLESNYKDKLKISKGIEVGIQPHVIKNTIDLLNKYRFDFIIGSVHIIDKQDPYLGEYYKGKTKKEAYTRYLEEILFMLNNFDEFDVLGHIDYITRYSNYEDRSLYYDDYPDLIDSILKKLIDMGKGMEINTSSYREKPGIKTCVYDIKILQRYKELGGRIITLGSDAHSEEYIGYKFSYFKDMLLDVGFDYITYFIDRKPQFIEI